MLPGALVLNLLYKPDRITLAAGLLGDLDLNGKVDILDFDIFAGHFG